MPSSVHARTTYMIHAWVLLHCTARQQKWGCIGQLTRSTELMVPAGLLPACIGNCLFWFVLCSQRRLMKHETLGTCFRLTVALNQWQASIFLY